MIQQFRHERNSSKEKSHRGNSGGRYNRDDGSPTDGLMRSSRQSSGSPDAWQRQRMSPLRHQNQWVLLCGQMTQLDSSDQ